jgi:hypothetical protein
MYKTTEKKQYEKPKMKVQPVRAQATLMQCSEGIGKCPVIHIDVDE